MAQKIEYSDNLKKGTDKLNESIEQSNVAAQKAITAEQTANQAIQQSESTQTQLDNIVIEGDSSVEAAQARVDSKGESFPTLKSRIDNFEVSATTQLQQSVTLQRNGQIVLPIDFPNLPFSITRLAKRLYKHTVNPYNQFDWSDAVEVFITHVGGSTTDGTNVNQPVSLGRFKSNLDSNIYGANKKFILSFLPNVYYHNSVVDFNNSNIDILIRSMSPAGFTWIVTARNTGEYSYSWSPYQTIFKTVLGGTTEVADIVNPLFIDDFGMPFPYIKTATLTECLAKKGSFFQSGADLYVNPNDGEEVGGVLPHYARLNLGISGTTGVTMIENMGFTAGSYSFNPTDVTKKMYLFNSRFSRGKQDAFAITGAYQAFMFDCVAAYGSKDGFNYHTSSEDSIAVEVNCISYGHGKYKMTGGNITTNSNNASTAHDGMSMFRIGGKYWECEGPVADEDCYSITIGCENYDLLSTATGKKSGFYMYNVSRTLPKYVIECVVSGKHFEYSVDNNAGTQLIAMGIESAKPSGSNVTFIDSWEDVV